VCWVVTDKAVPLEEADASRSLEDEDDARDEPEVVLSVEMEAELARDTADDVTWLDERATVLLDIPGQPLDVADVETGRLVAADVDWPDDIAAAVLEREDLSPVENSKAVELVGAVVLEDAVRARGEDTWLEDRPGMN